MGIKKILSGEGMTEVHPRGRLFLVATPIGNLEDITLRAIRVLKEVALVAAEDTRRTIILLRAYDIHVSLISLHNWNEERRSRQLMVRLAAGDDIAYVSDAGTPGISDPGYRLVKQAVQCGITVIPIPGPSALLAALTVSGLPMDRFVFCGFLPARTARRRQALSALHAEERTLIFYEAPHRLQATLDDLCDVLGDRAAVVARELTKFYEEILRGSLFELRDTLRERKIKGEITLVVSGQGMAACSLVEAMIETRKRERGE